MTICEKTILSTVSSLDQKITFHCAGMIAQNEYAMQMQDKQK